MEYYRVVKTPMELDKLIKDEEERDKKKAFIKNLFKKFGYLLLIPVILAGPVLMLSAYEAHIINITARVCIPLETRTPGYWKTHEEITSQLLPQTLGLLQVPTCDTSITVSEFEEAFDILDSNAKDMKNKLESQLLAMKFNIAYYAIGFYIPNLCGADGRTLNQLVAEADSLLCNKNAPREDLEAMKNILDCSNNLGEKTRTCLGLLPEKPSSFSSISNEVLLMTNEGELIQTEAPAEGEASIEIIPPSEENPVEETPTEETPSEETPNEAPTEEPATVEEPITEEQTPPAESTTETPTESTPELTTTPEPTPEPTPTPTETNTTTTNETTTLTE